MSKPKNHYCDGTLARKSEELEECARKKSFGCIHAPLVDVPLPHVVLDELHLMLRITGS